MASFNRAHLEKRQWQCSELCCGLSHAVILYVVHRTVPVRRLEPPNRAGVTAPVHCPHTGVLCGRGS